MSICVIFQTSYPAWAQSVPVQPVVSWDLEQVFLWACPLVTAPPSIKHGPYLNLGLCRLLEQINKLQENSTPGETVTTFENESPCPRSSERCNETPKLAAPETDWLYLYKLNLEFLVTCVFLIRLFGLHLKYSSRLYNLRNDFHSLTNASKL